MSKLYKISEVSKLVNLIDPNTKKPLNYILRYWEKEFSSIKPKKFNNQRYYTSKQVDIIKAIKYLLKIRKMTIPGVKSLLKLNINKLDDNEFNGLKRNYLKTKLVIKSKNILEKIKTLKNYGKKNSS